MRKQILACALALLLAIVPLGLSACAGQGVSSASSSSSSSSAASSSASSASADGESPADAGEGGAEGAEHDGGAVQSGGAEAGAPAGTDAGASSSQGNAPAPAPEPDPTISVTVSIDSSQAGGQSIGSYSRTVTLSPDASAYDALVATGASVGGSSSYVTSINGLSEKACGPTSGWTYYVNGSFPSKPAGSYKLNSDASVLWYYVTSPDSRP